MNLKEDWSFIVFFIVLTLCFFNFLRKRKKLGKPLLKIGSIFNPQSIIIVFYLLIIYNYIVMLRNSLILLKRHPEFGYSSVIMFIMSLVLLFYMIIIQFYVYFRKHVIYENGIIKPPRFFLFKDIESFSWENESVLQIKYKTHFLWIPWKTDEKWQIPKEMHDEIDRILTKNVNKQNDINAPDVIND